MNDAATRTKNKNFELFSKWSRFTDDTVMKVAVADWLMKGNNLVPLMQAHGNRYSNAGYGGCFRRRLSLYDPQPYNSFGNGSAMRVSPVGWTCKTLEETLEKAKQSAEVTHNHPEGIKGAQAVAAAIFPARTGSTKQEIKDYITATFDYDINRPYEEIKRWYHFDVTCQGSVPESIICFMKSHDYEDAVRLAVSLGGDADTMAAIAAEPLLKPTTRKSRITSIEKCFPDFPRISLRQCSDSMIVT